MYSFASISILALCCYTFLLAAFMAARKTPIGNAFIMALISGVLQAKAARAITSGPAVHFACGYSCSRV